MIQESLKVAALQLDPEWENPVANRAKMDEFLERADADTDIVFLPEMFTTGFSVAHMELAETMDGETVQWMKTWCREHQLALCGSLIIRENDLFFNRLLFVHPSGEVQFYNKHHLFTMGGEESCFQKGTERLIVEYKGWRICPLICYDLRFPVWARNRNEYDILVYSASWPKARNEVWNTLLKARAIENQAYVVGVNRVGVDGNLIAYSGNSQLIDAKGNLLIASDHVESIISARFLHSELLKFRSEFPVLNDADSFSLSCVL